MNFNDRNIYNITYNSNDNEFRTNIINKRDEHLQLYLPLKLEDNFTTQIYKPIFDINIPNDIANLSTNLQKDLLLYIPLNSDDKHIYTNQYISDNTIDESYLNNISTTYVVAHV